MRYCLLNDNLAIISHNKTWIQPIQFCVTVRCRPPVRACSSTPPLFFHAPTITTSERPVNSEEKNHDSKPWFDEEC